MTTRQRRDLNVAATLIIIGNQINQKSKDRTALFASHYPSIRPCIICIVRVFSPNFECIPKHAFKKEVKINSTCHVENVEFFDKNIKHLGFQSGVYRSRTSLKTAILLGAELLYNSVCHTDNSTNNNPATIVC